MELLFLSLLGLAALGATGGFDLGPPGGGGGLPPDPDLPEDWLPDEWPPPDAAPGNGDGSGPLPPDTVLIRGDGADDLIWIEDPGLAEGGAGNDTLIGTGDTTLSGSAGDDLLLMQGAGTAFGGDGDDLIDILDGGAGIGGDGNDILHANGSAHVAGGEGNDMIAATVSLMAAGGAPAQIIAGGAGADSFAIGFDASGSLAASADCAGGVDAPLTLITDFDPAQDHLSLLVGEFPMPSGASSLEASAITSIALSDTTLGTWITLSLLPPVDATGGPHSAAQVRLLLAGAHGLDAGMIDILQRGEQGRITGMQLQTASLAPVDLSGASGDGWTRLDGDSYVMGSTGNDRLALAGSAGYALLGDGDDQLTTASPNLIAHGGAGHDVIHQIAAEGDLPSQSLLSGGTGNDSFAIDAGGATIDAGPGNDSIVAAADARLEFNGGAGDDWATIHPGHRVGEVEHLTLRVDSAHLLANGPATAYALPQDATLTIALAGDLAAPVAITETIIAQPDGTRAEYIYEIALVDGTPLITLEAGISRIADIAARVTVITAQAG